METALTQLEKVKTEDPTLHHNAMMYLSLIVVCRRDKDEQPQLLRMINTHAENKEVERTIMTNIEVLIQEGKAEGLEQGRIYEKRTGVLKKVTKTLHTLCDDKEKSKLIENTMILCYYRCMEEWKSGRMEGWKSGRVEDGRLEEWKMVGWKSGRVEDGRLEEWKSGCVEKARYGRITFIAAISGEIDGNQNQSTRSY